MGKTLCVSRIGREGYAILASAQFDPIQGRGSIWLRQLTDGANSNHVDSVEFWGFHGTSYMNAELNVVDENMNFQVPADTPLPKLRKPLDQNKSKKSIQSKRAQLFVTPETKGIESRPKIRTSKTSDNIKVCPMTNDVIEITREQDKSVEKKFILPTIEALQTKASNPVNLISDTPDKQQSSVVAKKLKRKATDSTIASFFQKSKARKGENKKAIGMSRSSVKYQSSSPIISISTSDALITEGKCTFIAPFSAAYPSSISNRCSQMFLLLCLASAMVMNRLRCFRRMISQLSMQIRLLSNNIDFK